MSHVTFFFLFFGQSGEAYRWRVCYQRGLPRLVNRPGVAGAVLQSPLLLVSSLIQSAFSSIFLPISAYFSLLTDPVLLTAGAVLHTAS